MTDCDDGKLRLLNDHILQNPQNINALVQRGWFFVEKRDWDEAIEDLSNAIRHVSAYAEEGGELGSTDEENLRVAYELRSWAFLQKGETDKAFSDSNEVISRNLTGDLAGAFHLRGTVSLIRENFTQAIDDLSEALQRGHEENALTWHHRGVAYFYECNDAKHMGNFRGSNKLDQAISDFSKAIELKPGDSAAFIFRARSHSLKGDHDQAIKDLTEAIRLEPDAAEAWKYRGRSYRALGREDEAQADFKKAAELDYDDTI